MKIKFKRLDYQEKCLNQILGVFKGIYFEEPENDAQRIANPVFETEAIKNVLLENIEDLRFEQKITQGSVGIEKSLNCDILMETGTGKTFCFLECVYALHKNYYLSKFIVLVPSNAIKLGVLKSIEITREFFKSEYSNTHLESYENAERFILASNHKCCVLVMTFSAFNKEKNTIHQSCLENTNLFNGAKSYMQALASIRPIVIMDEPHRFLGDKTKKYLEQLNALITLRFGATFKDDYNNLIYALDSKKAFDCALVKSISVASVGESDEYFLELKEANKKQNEATINYTNLENKIQSVKVKTHDNLGVLTHISALEDYIVENITKKEIRFLNGVNLLLDQKEPFSYFVEGEQEVMLKEAIKSHFEREEGLFKKGIKALCMVFISGVNSYLSENEQPAKLALLFEKLYQQELEKVLKTPSLDENYRAYLERTKDDIKKVHGGYFAKSKKEGDEAKAIELILKEKEKLLSFDSDLRFIFSQWALQEGWDNPNVMTICKLAPSHSNITKLQQIGRGLRLAVNDKGERITKEHADFDFVNELVVIVPQVEGDFVGAIQQEISEHSLIKQAFSGEELEKSGMVKKGYYGPLFEKLEGLGFGERTDDENFKLTLNQNEFLKKEPELETLKDEKYLMDFEKLKDFLEDRLIGNSRVRNKNERKTEKIKINKENFKKFETLWAGLNHQARIAYAIDSESLIEEIVKKINASFKVSSKSVSVTMHKKVETMGNNATTETFERENACVWSLHEFISALSNKVKLSFKSVAKVLENIDENKFNEIKKNEQESLKRLEELFLEIIYQNIKDKISYQMRETTIKNRKNYAFYDEKGEIREFLNGSLGADKYEIKNSSAREKCLYENFMQVDSEIEKDTIEESNDTKIIVFGKLPRVKIPIGLNQTYSPDFGYVVENNDKKVLLVVETKGVDKKSELRPEEERKISTAKKFFEALKKQGVNIEYQTKLNNDQLSALINEVLNRKG
ncbi:type III restriction-modification system endonuclease [Helicobacter pylori]|uniref:Type III restriction enzyme, res subunit n=1 Tax=Helicobacter pylori HP260AFii TaxID=1159077 RepID=A0ABC9SAZ8_HELPX|nr:type III restriction-modification system endonuclease [Helicobacter pylori]EMH20388.1 type III restriction enzyme, res subunit [Helicobacter pylori GAM260ASi]EMH32353.1 type III restriction enzyme, res subunit [Helicobacter pylori GAM268Bii]EMH64556.1 type III restriction enzyme, res subunit [Helicobacter pylori HP260AFi]EMH67962.1 type III restriction enzyme, res subunit [Helicobacter pylori HP260AFii]EMH69373.1 type III restriction enzyme, res subunit [Helicobacter pylori HP260ASii]